MEHPSIIRPSDHAEWRSDRMGKTTLFQSKRLLIGLNSFEPGQFHALHSHEGMDKVYQVVEGEGVVLLEGGRISVATRDAVEAESLDEVADKAAAMLRARREKESAARSGFAELEASLLRELRKVVPR